MTIMKKSLPVVVIAVSMLAAPAAMAMNYGHDYSRYNRENCLFKSGMVQKGGEETRTGIYDTTDTDQKKYCSHSNMYEARNDRYPDKRYYNKSRTRVDANGRVVRY
jgi:hypothetical protein